MKTLTNHNTTLVEEGEVAQYPLSHPTHENPKRSKEKDEGKFSQKNLNPKWSNPKIKPQFRFLLRQKTLTCCTKRSHIPFFIKLQKRGRSLPYTCAKIRSLHCLPCDQQP